MKPEADQVAADESTHRRGGLGSPLRLQVAVLFVLVFACGSLSALLARKLYAASSSESLMTGQDRIFFDRFSREFRLTRRQQADLRLILEEKARRKRSWWNDLMQRTADHQALLDIDRKADRRILAVLNDAQRRAYREACEDPSSTKY